MTVQLRWMWRWVEDLQPLEQYTEMNIWVWELDSVPRQSSNGSQYRPDDRDCIWSVRFYRNHPTDSGAVFYVEVSKQRCGPDVPCTHSSVLLFVLDLHLPVSAEPSDWATAGDTPHQDDTAGVAHGIIGS